MFKLQFGLIAKVVFLVITVAFTTYLTLIGETVYLILLIPVIIYQVYDFYRLNRLALKEVNQFVDSVYYNDFSRHFNVKSAPASIKPLRIGFNEINKALKQSSKEKETQYQYLQKILELVETGILSFEMESGEIVWMNESLKKLLEVPYLKTIHSLSKRDWDLYHEVMSMPLGQSIVVTAKQDRNPIKILLSATAFQTEGKKYKLIAFQNVNETLDENENKAWQKLLSVMTHEIMNSVAPISSLSDTLKHRLAESKENVSSQNLPAFEDIELGIETIKRRSEGLLKFADTYRNLNKISKPNIKKIYVRDLFENLQILMQPTFDQKNIELDVILKDPDLTIEVDQNLIEQVIINLLVNAIDATKENEEPVIALGAYLTHGKKAVIKVSDNGSGITEDVLDQIFVPFFSTKKTGSGIGLSLCKQIMMVHRGNINVQSKPGEGTAFTLSFN